MAEFGYYLNEEESFWILTKFDRNLTGKVIKEEFFEELAPKLKIIKKI